MTYLSVGSKRTMSSTGRTAVMVSLTSLLYEASIVKNTMTLYTLFVVLITMAIALPLFYTYDGLFAILANFGHLE